VPPATDRELCCLTLLLLAAGGGLHDAHPVLLACLPEAFITGAIMEREHSDPVLQTFLQMHTTDIKPLPALQPLQLADVGRIKRCCGVGLLRAGMTPNRAFESSELGEC